MKSTVNIGGHPLHPMLVPLPIGLLIATFLCDLAYWGTGAPFWANAAFWALAAGILTAAVAAVVGLADFAGDRAIRQMRDAWHHMIGNVIAVVIALVNLYVRYLYGPEEGVFPWGIWMSFAVFLLLAFTGWKGGELVYRHGAAVIDVPPR